MLCQLDRMTALRCPVSCHTCHLLDPAVRCDNAHLKLPMTPAYTPGQMDTVLSGVKREQEHRFQVATLSNTPWVMQVCCCFEFNHMYTYHFAHFVSPPCMIIYTCYRHVPTTTGG